MSIENISYGLELIAIFQLNDGQQQQNDGQ